MSVVLPRQVPLEPPPEREFAVRGAVEAVAAAAHRLALVVDVLRGPSGRAPRWQGADAVAAAGETAAVARLTGGLVESLVTAAGRLSAHAALLGEAHRSVAVLRAEQDDDFAAAWGRVARLLPDPATAMRTGSPEAVALVEDLRVAEDARRRRHAALLEDVDDDARGTAEVLARVSGVLGGTGRSGDEARVVAHLAALLPEWGDAELTDRGRALADAWRLADDRGREALAAAALPHASVPAFASALLAGLGPSGVEDLFFLLGDGELPAVAAVLAAAFGAAVTSGRRADPVREVLEARYVDPEQAGSTADVVVLGMGAVLAAGLDGPGRGPAPSVVLDWGRQMLAREVVQASSGWGPRALDRAGDTAGDPPADPLLLVARDLARADDPAHAAALLGEHAVWDQLLARTWDDGARGLAELVARAADDPGPVGQSAVRTGLEVLGTGLEDHDPDGWRVDRGTARAIAPALAGGLAAHVTVAVDSLWIGVTGPAAAEHAAAARGLGLLTLEPAATAVLADALHGWAREDLARHGAALDGSAPVPAVAVPSAFLAAQEYGHDLDRALDGFAARDDAERHALGWDLAVGWIGQLPGPLGVAGGLVDGYGALVLGVDGTWDVPPDTGPLREAEDAVADGRDALGPVGSGSPQDLARQARAAFDRAAAVLGEPLPPESPESDWLAPLLDAFLGLAGERTGPGPRVAPGD